MSVCLEIQDMRVRFDISPYWPNDEHGEPRTVNSVFEEIKGTSDEVGRNTLRLALNGDLDRGLFLNQVKLARLCSRWSGRTVNIDELFKIDESKEN